NTSLSYILDSSSVDYFGFSQKELNVSLKWTDLAGESNYYRAYSSVSFAPYPILSDSLFNYYGEHELRFNGSFLLVSDKNVDGKEMGPYIGNVINSDYTAGVSTILNLHLLNIDKNYYEFFNDLQTVEQRDPFS